MAIFRGDGGAGDANNDVTVSTVTQKASDAASSATAAASSASTASTKAGEASTSASTASTKASEASTSASNASTSASTASTQATNASNSATAAASSASTAAGHASNSALKANNLSDLASASTARGNLGLTIGTHVQAYDADLSAIGALAKTDSNFIVGNGSTWVLENASTARTSLGLGTAAVTATGAYATAAQGTKADNAAAKASNLSDLASASTARTNLGLGTAATTAASAYATAAQGTTADNALAASAVSTFGGTLIDDANAGAARTTLGLGDVATTAASAYATAAQGTKADAASPLVTTVTKTASTGSGQLPSGTTAQRDGSPAAGMIRFNSTTSGFEGYDGSAWGSIGGGASAGGAIYENSNAISANHTLTSNTNAMSVSPLTIASGATVTIPSGARWVVL